MKRFFMVLFVSCTLAVVGCGSDSSGDGGGNGASGGDTGASGGDTGASGVDAGGSGGDTATPADDTAGPAPSDACGGCPEGTTCGLDPEHPTLCVGSDCGDVDFAGACADTHTVTWCEDGVLYVEDCALTYGAVFACGWNADEEYYDCLSDDTPCGGCPTGMACGLDPVNPLACGGGECGDVDEVGSCAADGTLTWCGDGVLYTTDCALSAGEGYTCGFDDAESYNSCLPPEDEPEPEPEPEPTLCETYCQLATETCTGEQAIDFGTDDCLTACGTWTEGVLEMDDADAVTGPAGGNSVACRIYHLTVAGGDPANGGPEVHCPHGAPDGGGVCVDTPDDLCLNDADIAVLEQSDVTAAASDAALTCLGSGAADVGACVLEAITTGTGISEVCGGCYVGAVLCAAANCIDLCIPDPSTAECVACQVENCTPDFHMCSGFTPGCGNGICEATEDGASCVEDCPAASACDEMCLAGCEDAAFQCPLDCTASCKDDCAQENQDCVAGCNGIPPCEATCSDEQVACDSICDTGATDCHAGCAPAQETCTAGCGCE